MPSVYAHIVTFNSPRCLMRSIDSLLEQQGFDGYEKLQVAVTDNASEQSPLPGIRDLFGDRVETFRNEVNLGFCGAHNQAARRFLDGAWAYFLLVNPDVRLEPGAVTAMVTELERYPESGLACPRLYRCDEELNPCLPPIIDAAGMYMTLSLRHLDRGSGQGQEDFDRNCFVFGGSGACLLIRRSCLEDLLLDAGEREREAALVCPALAAGGVKRALLFDEAFFAYREDADLAWRSQLMGWKCIYVASAIGYHRRVVLPDRRSRLPAEINCHGVRNRFLLQANNLTWDTGVKTFLRGMILRNLVVIMGVLVVEPSSRRALFQALRLLPRALGRRRRLFRRLTESGRSVQRLSQWFSIAPVIEPVGEPKVVVGRDD